MTEKQYAPTKTEKKATKADAHKSTISGAAKSNEKDFAGKTKDVVANAPKKKEKEAEEKTEAKVKKKFEPKVKKTDARVNAKSVPISRKESMDLCRFIKHKKIETAIKDLEDVLAHRRPLPMRGEIPHRKGKGMMSGRYPEKATGYFIRLTKSLLANSNHNGLDEPVITEAIANSASAPYGQFGRIRRKRTHITLVAKDKNLMRKK